jgi:putative ABC transport system substrate-binding protein
MAKRRLTLAVALVVGVLLSSPIAVAQQAGKVPRIAYLSYFPPNPYDDVFRRGLQDIGHVEGRTIFVEYRHADRSDERVRQLAAELVALDVDVIVTTTGESTRLVKDIATKTPIVMASSGDAVRQGLVASLARPGGNVTGMTNITPQLSGKRLEVLRDAFPRISRIALIWCPGNPVNERIREETQIAARSVRVELQSVGVHVPRDIGPAFDAAVKARADGVIISDCPRLDIKPTLDAATKTRLPTIYPFGFWARAGGLIAYGPDLAAQVRRAATYVDMILRGAKAADLPVEQPTKFELVINVKTAKTLGMTISSSVLLRADEVIEQ